MLSRVIEAGEEENSYLLTFHGRFGGKRFGYEIHFLGKPLFRCVVRDRSPLQPPMCTLVECGSFPLLQALAAYSLSATIKPYLSMVFSPCLRASRRRTNRKFIFFSTRVILYNHSHGVRDVFELAYYIFIFSPTFDVSYFFVSFM